MTNLSHSAQQSGWEDYPAGQWDERKPISWLHDWPFWHYCLETYGDISQPVLELACGNGRITRQMLSLGYQVVAVDVNPRFLSRAQQYIPSEQQDKVTLLLQDVVHLDVNAQFQIVIMADWAFPALLTQADLVQFFARLREHLQPNGIFAFNTPFPSVRQLGLQQDENGWYWPDSRRFDVLTQIETRYSGGILLQFRHTTLAEIQLLGQGVGLEIIEQYGNVDRRPLRGLLGDDLTLIMRKVA